MRPHQSVALPERPRDKASAGNAPVVDWISHAPVQNNRPKTFKENDPHRDMKTDFPPSGWFVIGTKTDPSVDEEVNRQRHGHRQGVVEMTVKEGGIMMQMRFDQRAVDDVDREADKENGIAPVTKPSAPLSRH